MRNRVIPPEERALRAGHRLDMLRSGSGDFTTANRALAIKQTEAVMDAALAEIRMGLGRTWGHA